MKLQRTFICDGVHVGGDRLSGKRGSKYDDAFKDLGLREMDVRGAIEIDILCLRVCHNFHLYNHK